MGVLRALRSLPFMEQTWNDLLFAHWPVPASQVRPLLPRTLTLDTHEGRAWIGITPFVLSGLRLKGLPPLPGGSSFPEVNVRTYVIRGGRPGIHFLSLDAGHALAVAAARVAFLLPYFQARMDVRRNGEGLSFASRRGAAVFSAEYAPAGPAFTPSSGSLEHWLTERYCFFTGSYRCDIHHRPWVLKPARGTILRNTLARAAGIRLPDTAPLLHYSKGVRVDVWPLTPAS